MVSASINPTANSATELRTARICNYKSVRVIDANNKTTTISILLKVYERYIEYANGDAALVRKTAQKIARKCAKKPGLSLSVQVREKLVLVLRGMHRPSTQ